MRLNTALNILRQYKKVEEIFEQVKDYNSLEEIALRLRLLAYNVCLREDYVVISYYNIDVSIFKFEEIFLGDLINIYSGKCQMYSNLPINLIIRYVDGDKEAMESIEKYKNN